MEGVLVDYYGAMLTCYLLNTVTSSPMKGQEMELELIKRKITLKL